jgi:hypothetical protein
MIFGVFPGEQFTSFRGLFEGLAQLQAIEFKPLSSLTDAEPNAFILIAPSLNSLQEATRQGKPIFVFLSAQAPRITPGEPIRFSSSSLLDGLLRNRILQDAVAPNGAIGTMGATKVEEFARKGSDLVWARTTFPHGSADVVAYGPPWSSENQHLFERWEGKRFMPLLPLIHFIRQIGGDSTWQRPPVRACFILDDLNLHWPSYGYIRYGGLIESARRHNYHVAMATVPLDSWFTHRPTADLFRRNPDRISLLIHGNNHTRQELARRRTAESNRRLGAQALRRIARLEALTALNVSRVMVPPHGACSESTAAALLQLGFEAVCVSRGAIMTYNPQVRWPRSAGLTPAAFVGGGMPVIPRFGRTRYWQNDVLLAAFIGQPILPLGHHNDFKDGYGVLEESADFVNSLGPVHWTNMTEIARTNFLQRRSPDTLHVRAFSRRLRFNVPPGTGTCTVEPAWPELDRQGNVVVEQKGESSQVTLDARKNLTINDPGGELQIHFVHRERVDHNGLPPAPGMIWPFARRVLSEGRDRVQSLLSQ